MATADCLLEDVSLGNPKQARRCLVHLNKDKIEMSHGLVIATNDWHDEFTRHAPEKDVIDMLKRQVL